MDSETVEARTRLITWADPAERLKAAPHLSGLEFIQAVASGKLAPPPISQLIGMGMESVSEGHVVFTLEPGEYHYNPLGTVHGGIIATVLDSAMGCAVQTALPRGKIFTTLELKVNYVRAVYATTGTLRCEGKVIHVGGRVATADGKLFDKQGKLIAHGSTTCMVLDAPKPGA